MTKTQRLKRIERAQFQKESAKLKKDYETFAYWCGYIFALKEQKR